MQIRELSQRIESSIVVFVAPWCWFLMLIGSVWPHQASAMQPEVVSNFLEMRFVRIPAGSFQMGTAEDDRQAAIMEMPEPDDNAFRDEQPLHEVTFNKPLLLGQTEVTQGQWLRVMENRPGPVAHWQRKDWKALPVAGVSWDMARRFAEELGKLDPDYDYRLPSEAEWEYAARGGKSGLRPMADDELSEYAWFIANSGDEPHPVASRKANAFGIYDMLGNVWEWVADRYAADTYGGGSKRLNPTGPTDGRSRVRRGGSYHCPLYQTRPSFREANTPDTHYSVIGFRVVGIPEPAKLSN